MSLCFCVAKYGFAIPHGSDCRHAFCQSVTSHAVRSVRFPRIDLAFIEEHSLTNEDFVREVVDHIDSPRSDSCMYDLD